VPRAAGLEHQAGSDSLITAAVFFKIEEQFFHGQLPEFQYNGQLFGLGNTYMNGTDNVRAGTTLAERERNLPATRDHVNQTQVGTYGTPLTSTTFTPVLHNHYVR
jgi:hypothetical protein